MLRYLTLIGEPVSPSILFQAMVRFPRQDLYVSLWELLDERKADLTPEFKVYLR